MSVDSLNLKNKPETLFSSPNYQPTPSEIYKFKLANDLGLALEPPKQSKRIFALYKLFSYYLLRSETKSYIALKIVEIANKLKSKYQENIVLINECLRKTNLKKPADLHREISFIDQKDLMEFQEGEDRINFLKQLLYYYDRRKEGDLELSASNLKLNITALQQIEEEAFECYLRLLDVNYELRNTIIGAENKKSIYFLSQKYVDLYTICEQYKSEFLSEIEKLRESMVKEYCDIMRNFSLPANKLVNFRLFIQKKIESRMYEAQFLKLQSTNSIDYQLNAIDNNCNELKRQYLLSLKEISSIVNYYKTRIIQYQTFFSFEIEKLVTYLRENYLNLINMIFTNLAEARIYLKNKKMNFDAEELDVVLALEREKMEEKIKELKMKYSAILVPLVSAINSETENMENRHCFNLRFSEERYVMLKNLKNKSIESWIKKFEAEKKKIEDIVLDKQNMLKNLGKKMTYDIDLLVEQLRDECNTICCNLLRENQYFWTKYNAEFNCVSREYFVKLYCEYSPYINSWKDGEEGWMHEYLKLKLNLEYLKKIGSSVKEFSPEGRFYEKCSNLLDSYSNIFRNVCLQRDRVERESLSQLNTIPKIDYSKVEEKLNNSLRELKSCHTEYLKLKGGLLGGIIESKY